MSEFTRFTLADGDDVVVELAGESGLSSVSRRDDVIADAKVSFETALASIRSAASSALSQFQSMARQPDEVEIKFAVKLSASAGAVIAKTAMDGQLEVKLKWSRDPAAIAAQDERTRGAEEPSPSG